GKQVHGFRWEAASQRHRAGHRGRNLALRPVEQDRIADFRVLRIDEHKRNTLDDFWPPVWKDDPLRRGTFVVEHAFRADDGGNFIERNWDVAATLREEFEQVANFFWLDLFLKAFGHERLGRGLQAFDIFAEDNVPLGFGVDDFDGGFCLRGKQAGERLP